MKRTAKVYIGLIITLGALVLTTGAAGWSCADPVRLIVYLIFALTASGMKVVLPSIKGTLSVNFFFVLVGIIELSLGETLALGCASILFQYLWKGKSSRKPVQAAFNVASGAVAIYLAYSVFHW